MNDTLYRLGARLVRAGLRVPPLAGALGFFSRVWSRHHALWRHLRAGNFDGVIDGGANIGEFAALARAALPSADLVCVEPHPPSAACLRREGFRVVEAALWHTACRLQLAQPGPATTSCTVLPTDAGMPRWEVVAVRLDQIEVAGQRLLVKLDLQGAEPAALQGMSERWKQTAAVLIESRTGPQEGAAQAMLRGQGFFFYAVTNELWERDRVTERDELWLRPESFMARGLG